MIPIGGRPPTPKLARAASPSMPRRRTPRIRLARELRRLGARAGMGLKPATPVEPYEDLLDELDMLLLMTVERASAVSRSSTSWCRRSGAPAPSSTAATRRSGCRSTAVKRLGHHHRLRRGRRRRLRGGQQRLWHRRRPGRRGGRSAGGGAGGRASRRGRSSRSRRFLTDPMTVTAAEQGGLQRGARVRAVGRVTRGPNPTVGACCSDPEGREVARGWHRGAGHPACGSRCAGPRRRALPGRHRGGHARASAPTTAGPAVRRR